MDRDDDAWSTERRLWLDGVDAYMTLVDRACLMAFPQMGPMRFDAIIEGLRQAPRWQAVEMAARMLARPADDLLVLAYTAEARRPGGPPYRCHCTSTYRRAAEGWRLVQHQQTLAD